MAPSRSRSQWRHLFTLPNLLALAFAWLPLAVAEKTAADYFISSLPGAPEPLLKQYAGHIEITPEHHGNLFFWFYKNRHIANRSRLVIWLNGGPGCSSLDGALMEIGPYRVKEDGTLTYNEGSWDEFANVLFVDNPVGTGFSYVDGDSYTHELTEMSAQFVAFLEKWFVVFPEYTMDDIYIAGESYAGQHIPYIARAMLDRNAANPSAPAWNVSGLLIGNGWISGPDQYPAYLQFGYEAGLITSGSDEERQIQDQQKKCYQALDKGGKDHVDTGSCEGILQEILRLTAKNGDCINMYDTRLHDSYPSCGMSWPPDLKQVTPYLRRSDVISALHINPDKKTGWQECNGQVSSNFKAYNSPPAVTLLPGLLEQLPIILFSGDKDLICNHIGTETLISNLIFNNGTGMETSPGVYAPRRDWSFENEPAGIYQSARNLTYIKFYNSSHMVPFDFPRRTRDMLDRFMGVDIASIGGQPADSRIDGEKAHPETSVGGHPNSTSAEEAAQAKADKAAYKAYQRSSEAALALLIIVLVVVGLFWWRGRRRRAGYKSLFGGGGSDPYDGRGGGAGMASGLGLDGERFREREDVEAAREYDESELDDLGAKGRGGGRGVLDEDAFDLGDDESGDEGSGYGKLNGNGHAR
ncbi:Cell death protease [Recurvomyces mirabilis]|uniref:Carboxypeptidase n=1 Tax=Recurvomyces mirabilis TaxID=574656 RepID=A0AAE0WIE9_9PEZI|nr:Cell death protease [Recurvomyces mirabilis]KAK5152133.1 Cell death protease [Recurvomyces mirabilis]